MLYISYPGAGKGLKRAVGGTGVAKLHRVRYMYGQYLLGNLGRDRLSIVEAHGTTDQQVKRAIDPASGA